MTYLGASKALGHVDRLAAWQAGEKPAPVTVEWDLSNRCSLGCEFCHFAHTHSKGPWARRMREVPEGFGGTGDLANADLVGSALPDLAAAGVQSVVWSGGGEPTLHPQWQHIMRAARDAGLRQGMYTLGGHLDVGKAAALAELATWVVVSLDAVDAETYGEEKGVPARRFHDACNGVRDLASCGACVVGVSFLLHEMNWSYASGMLSLARELGATYATFRPTIITSPVAPASPLGDRSWVTEALPLLAELADHGDVECETARFAAWRDWSGRHYPSCYGIRLSATITPDGRVWICPQRRGVEDSCVGDLRVSSFEEIWSRHPGEWSNFSACRAMCRLHLINEVLSSVFDRQPHAEFI